MWILVVGGFVSIMLHNLIDALFGFEEALFFIIVVFVIPIYFLISVIYSLINYFKKNKKRLRPNWTLGFLGFLGFNGIPELLTQDCFGATWLLWFLWFLWFLPEKK